MSEPAGNYSVKQNKLISKDVLCRRACCYRYSDRRYRPPTGHEIDSLIHSAGWTQTEFAEYLGVSISSRGSSTIRRWKAELGSESHRTMPYASWRLALYEAGVIAVDSN